MSNQARNTSRIATAMLLCLLLPGLSVFAVNEALINRKADGSRAEAAHKINLMDADGVKIAADDFNPKPISTRKTCGECHNYDKIAAGFHFNAGTTSDTQKGRQGEPWILSDKYTKTQLPVSLRGGQGVWKPEQIGMTPWQFTKAFGGHFPGGGVADVDADSTASLDAEGRWAQSGALEINCLACHSGSPHQDMAEFAAQVGNGNLKWATTAASGLASVEGSVKSLPAWYDPALGQPIDDPEIKAPRVSYQHAYFDRQNRASLDIKGRPEASRCYFCHSTAHNGTEKHMSDQDVHMAAGLTCVDCHRNGIDHQILSGRENDPILKETPEAMTLTCKGCHLGEEGKGVKGGRMRAPVPEHKGLPPIHLEKMSCTSCHSGAVPQDNSGLVKVARAHKLGARNSSDAATPMITSPVFQKIDGKLHPCNMVWPAFWATMKDDKVQPLLPAKVLEATGTLLVETDGGTTGTEELLTEGKVVAALKKLSEAHKGEGEAVYVSGGKLHKIGPEGKLAVQSHASAEPYAWAIGHDVRPAGQSLGAKGCTECHAQDAPFFFGEVQVANPLCTDTTATVKMASLEGQDINYAKMFGWSFTFRPLFKYAGFAGSALVLGVMLSYGLLGLGALCRFFGRKG